MTVFSLSFLRCFFCWRKRESPPLDSSIKYSKSSSDSSTKRKSLSRTYSIGSPSSALLEEQSSARSYNSSSPSSTRSYSSSSPSTALPEDRCRRFSFTEIQKVTKNFSDEYIIGNGGFGIVYKGFIIDDGNRVVAIKRLNMASQRSAFTFKNEVKLLAQLHHRHLVSMVGFCSDKREKMVVYDYMSNGSLRDHLYGKNNDPLPWKKRLKICIGAARGLHYLHSGLKHTIIHRDVKTSKILLSKEWVAKVSDFGYSKLSPKKMLNAPVTATVRGTVGYLDPEYNRRKQLTEKSDVYSFGVVLFEVLSARPAVDIELVDEQKNLADWACTCIQKNTLDQLIDPYLKGKIAPECLKEFVEIAESCLIDQGYKRPTMGEIIECLVSVLELQEGADEAVGIHGWTSHL